MPTASPYYRFSAKKQEQGDSIRRQKHLAIAAAQRFGLILGRAYEDHSVSAYRGKNAAKGALYSFRRDVESGRINPGTWLLIEDFDRLSRQVFSKTYLLFTELVEAGVTICTTADQRVYNKANANDLDIVLITLLKMMTGNQESAKKSERLSDLWKERRENGFKSAVCPGWVRLNEDGDYEVRPERVPTVRKIFDLAEAGLGSPTICKIVNADPDHPPFEHKHGNRGRKWHTTTIDNILTGRHVLGEFQAHKMVDGVPVPEGDVKLGWYPVVISEGQWSRVQALRTTKPKGKRSSKLTNLFQGVVKCGHCDGTMRVKMCQLSKKRTSGQDHDYFVCSNALLKKDCEAAKYFPVDLVENAILDHTKEYRLHEIFSDPKVFEELRAVEDQIASHKAIITSREQGTKNLNGRLALLPPDDPAGESLLETVRGFKVEMKDANDSIRSLEQRRLILGHRIDHRADAEDNVRALRAEMARAEGDELLTLRAKLSQAVKTFITHMSFDPLTGFITVSIGSEMRTHHFQMHNRKGRNAGREIKYYGPINYNNDEMRLILGLPPKDWNSVRSIATLPMRRSASV